VTSGSARNDRSDGPTLGVRSCSGGRYAAAAMTGWSLGGRWQWSGWRGTPQAPWTPAGADRSRLGSRRTAPSPQPLLLFILAGGYDAPWRLGQRPALGELSIGGAGEVHRAAPGKQRRRPAGQEDLHHPGCTVDVVGVGTSVAKAGRATPARPVVGSACSASQAGATPVTVLARGPAAAAGRSPKAAAFRADSRRGLRRTAAWSWRHACGSGGWACRVTVPCSRWPWLTATRRSSASTLALTPASPTSSGL
jgi:hypothetical protein